MGTKDNTKVRWVNIKAMLNNLEILQTRMKGERLYCELIIAPTSNVERIKINKHWLLFVNSNELNTLNEHLKELELIHNSYYKINIKSELKTWKV